MEKRVDLSIVIVSFNTQKLTTGCLDSVVKRTKAIEYEIIVVDNGSADGTAAEIQKLKVKNQNYNSKIKIIKNETNRGFAAGNNQGWKAARGKYILFLNSDTLILNNILGEMVLWMDKNPKVGVATCALKGKDGSAQGTGGYFPTLLRVFSWMTVQDLPFVDYFIAPFHPFHGKSFLGKGLGFYKKERELDWVTGAFLLGRKKILEDVGGWDEKYFMYVEEVDLCFRIKRAGWQVWYLPRWSLIHYGGASGTKELSVMSEFSGIKRFYKKFYPSWQFPALRFFLKLGALGRIVLFGILEGKEGRDVYTKAFREA